MGSRRLPDSTAEEHGNMELESRGKAAIDTLAFYRKKGLPALTEINRKR